MVRRSCPHGDAPRRRRVCGHLLDGGAGEPILKADPRAADPVLLCAPCARLAEPPLADACPGCFDALAARLQARPGAPAFEHQAVPVGGAPLWALAPLPDGARSTWIGADVDGVLRRISLDGARSEPFARTGLQFPLRIETSPCGRFVALLESRGSRGRVYDLVRNTLALRLVRGDVRVGSSEFPAVFVRDGGRTLLVHATDWNRLDLTDPETGETLSRRGSSAEHALDYHHAGLAASPDGRWLADDGWSGEPVGILRRVDLRRWRTENVWETEDGPSVQALRRTGADWDLPRCFVDGRTLAVWGVESGDGRLADGVTLFDLEAGRAVGGFRGPPRGRFSFDRHLVVTTADGGSTAWDLQTGTQVAGAPDFLPLAHHPQARRWATPQPKGVILESRWKDPG